MAVLGHARGFDVAAPHYDLAIVGAGINGAAIARDAALRGLSVVVLDKGDIGSGTSSWSSRLIHGGLRYLEHGELRLVRESLRDRERLLRIAPHLVTPLGFVVPVYRHNHRPGWMFRLGMHLYDALSPGKSMPRHRRLNRKALAVELPALDPDGLTSALYYYDGQVPFAERLVLETALSAAEAGAVVQTYATVTGVVTEDGRATGLRYHDQIAQEERTVRARVVVNAAGPWVDEVGRGLALDRMIGGTKGTHLVVDPFPGAPKDCVYYEARSDNRSILVIPWNGRYLIGTTDDRFEGDPDTAAASTEEVDYLLAETNALIPGAGLTRSSVLFTYAGIRPLPHQPDAKTGSIPRSHFILTHPEATNLVTVVGGKLTPHLALATEAVDAVARLLGRRLPPSRAPKTPLPGAGANWPRTARDMAGALTEVALPAELADRLVRVYGARCRDLMAIAERDDAWRRVVGTGRGAVLAAEVALAVEKEGATHLTDILHRRTMVGLEPSLGRQVDREVAEIAAGLFGWSGADVEDEVAAHQKYVGERLLGGVEQQPILWSS